MITIMGWPLSPSNQNKKKKKKKKEFFFFLKKKKKNSKKKIFDEKEFTKNHGMKGTGAKSNCCFGAPFHNFYIIIYQHCVLCVELFFFLLLMFVQRFISSFPV